MGGIAFHCVLRVPHGIINMTRQQNERAVDAQVQVGAMYVYFNFLAKIDATIIYSGHSTSGPWIVFSKYEIFGDTFSKIAPNFTCQLSPA